MRGLSRILGAGPVVRFAGRLCAVRSRTLRDYAEIEAQIIWLRGDPFTQARRLPEFIPDKQVLLETTQALFETFDETWAEVTSSECLQWVQTTWSGQCFAAWQGLRDNGPEFTLEYVTESFLQDEDAQRDVLRAVAQASGDDELGLLDQIPSIFEAAKHGTPTGWRGIVRSLADEPFLLRFADIERLTLAQCALMARSEKDLRGEISYRAEGWEHLRSVLSDTSKKAAENILTGDSWATGIL